MRIINTSSIQVTLMLLVSLSVLADATTFESTSTEALHIHQERVSGRVNHIPLRLILDQFHKYQGINYRASEAVLERPISVNFHQESLSQALAKILEKFDYVFKINPVGSIQEIIILNSRLVSGQEKYAYKAVIEEGNLSKSSVPNKKIRKLMGVPQGNEIDENPSGSIAFPMRPHDITPRSLSARCKGYPGVFRFSGNGKTAVA